MDRAHKKPAKLLDYFLQSSNSNINQHTENWNLKRFKQMELPAKLVLLDYFSWSNKSNNIQSKSIPFGGS